MSEFDALSIGIVGLGQMGGSLAAALSRKPRHGAIRGYDRKTEPGDEAARRAYLSESCPNAAELITTSEIVIIALPIRQIVEFIDSQSSLLAKCLLVTDTGSLKAEIVATARNQGLLNFIGGHPLAGTEKRGPDSWNDGLFDNCSFFNCGRETANLRSRLLFEMLLKQLEARDIVVDACVHDRIFATSSNLPHLMAYLLKAQFDQEPVAGDLRNEFVCPSYRGATRVARSDPEMVHQMLWCNRRNLSRSLSAFRQSLESAQKALDDGDPDAFHRILGMIQDQKDS